MSRSMGSRFARWSWALVVGASGCGAEAPAPTRTTAHELRSSADATPEGGAFAPAGASFPVCPGVGTRHLWFTGNFQPTAPWAAWDPTRPRQTSLWRTTFELYTAGGYAVSVGFYLVPDGERVSYHILLADSAIELASGSLSFDTDTRALASVRETRRLRLWGPDGFESPIEVSFGTPLEAGGTGLDGVTSLDTWTSFEYAADGRWPELGVACDAGPAAPASSTPPPMAPEPEPVVCVPVRSKSVSLRGNLDPDIPISRVPWDLTQRDATTTLYMALEPLDANGRLVRYGLYLVKRGAQVWDYHATLSEEPTGPERGAGRLHFNPDGTLQRVDVWRELRLVQRDGTPGERLTLNLGRGTSLGGSGADGLTSFRAGTLLTFVEHDGRAAAISPRCLDAGPPYMTRTPQNFWGPGAYLDDLYPLCAGSVSSMLTSYVLLSRFTPISMEAWDPTAPEGPSDYWASTDLYDTTLRPLPVQVRFRRVAEDSWEAHVMLDEGGALVERGALRLDVDENGLLVHVEGQRHVSIPLPDGSEGPPVALNFGVPLDERGVHSGDPLVAYQYGNGGIYADGWSPDVCDDL